MVIVVGIGDYAISRDPRAILVTYALSTCVAITAYDPQRKILGMAHMVLPDSKKGDQKRNSNPGYYIDIAIPLLLRSLNYEGNKGLEIKLYGGAHSIREDDFFKVGDLNLTMVKKIFKKLKISPCYEDTGGTVSRSIRADVATGRVEVKYQPLNI